MEEKITQIVVSLPTVDQLWVVTVSAPKIAAMGEDNRGYLAREVNQAHRHKTADKTLV